MSLLGRKIFLCASKFTTETRTLTTIYNHTRGLRLLSASNGNNLVGKYKGLPQRQPFRSKNAWFLGKRKSHSYEIVSLGEVGQSRQVPDYIPKPEYAATGVVPEHTSDIEVLDKNQIQYMRQSCALAKVVLDEVEKHIREGVTTDDLDAIAHTACISYGAYPSPLNYRGYPKSICTSVNNIACHGIPDSRKLKNGDIISVDVSVFYNGYHGDCAASYCVGTADEGGKKLLDIALLCLEEAIKICRPGQLLCQIGKTISSVAKHHGHEVIPAFCGHGIGSYFHGPPNILHYENEDKREMSEGMTFTIEPVICEGQPDIVILEDGWTAATEDNSRCAQFEHTILVTKEGSEVLTIATAFKAAQQ